MLLLSLIWGWTAWNAYHPWKSKPEMLGIFSFIFGFFAGELGLHLIAVEAALTLLIVLFGELSGFADALGLAITIISWIALAIFYFRGQRAAPIMQQAVNYALNKPTDSTVAAKDLLLHSPDAERLLNPFAFKRPAVKCHRDVPYTTVNGRTLYVDIYHRSDCPENAPVLFQIHGGAWMQNFGSKEQQALPLMTQMAENGWVCVAVQYRLSPTATFPEHIIDCKRGLAWVKENIGRYGGNPNFVVATGGSAGGHLSSLLALSPNAPEFQPGFEGADTRVQGCVPFYGVYDFTNSQLQRENVGLEAWISQKVLKKTLSEDEALWKMASPLSWINPDAPPFLIIHGEADTLVPVQEGRVFYEQLRQQSTSPVAYAELPDAQHAFDLVISLRCQIVVNYLCIYLTKLHEAHQQQQENKVVPLNASETSGPSSTATDADSAEDKDEAENDTTGA